MFDLKHVSSPYETHEINKKHGDKNDLVTKELYALCSKYQFCLRTYILTQYCVSLHLRHESGVIKVLLLCATPNLALNCQNMNILDIKRCFQNGLLV